MSRKGYVPQPLDFDLLAKLPDEGTSLGPHALARTVGLMAQTFGVTSQSVNARLRSMKVAGFVVNVKIHVGGSRNGLHGGVYGWQRTPKGIQALEDHQKGET